MTVEEKDGRAKAYDAQQTDQHNFDPFSECFEYRYEILSTLVDAVPHIPGITATDRRSIQIDVGTGNGLGMQATKGIFEALMRKALLIGVDFDERALKVAAANTPSTDNIQTLFIKGYAQDLDELLKGKIPSEGVDLVTFLDAVHEIPPQDQQGVISASALKLRPGGVFVMNSFFTSIAINATKDSYWQWIAPTMRAAREFGGEAKEEPSFLQRSPQEYTDMLLAAGLVPIVEGDPYHISIVNVSRQGRIGISHYPGFIIRVRDSYEFANPPSIEEFAPRLAYHYGISEIPLPRKVVRWIFQKPA